MRLIYLFIIFCLLFIFCVGCWDRVELNDRAIWLATAWDIDDDGNIEISGQIAIPSNIQMKGESVGQQPFFVISGKGTSVGEVLDNIQKKLPRKAFFGHRRVILLSEQFAEHGLKDLLDNISRTPFHSLRGALFVVKGTTAKEVLIQKNPLEPISAFTILKEHRLIGGRSDTLYLQFLIASHLNGIRPTLPVLEMTTLVDDDKQLQQGDFNDVSRIAGVAVFDKQLKLKGLLNNDDNKNLLWIINALEKDIVTAEHEYGNASIRLYNINGKITPNVKNGQLTNISIQLSGKGLLDENNSGWDVRKTKNVKKLEKAFENKIVHDVKKTIEKVQDEYSLDIFGLGEAIHRKYPKLWASLEKDWDETFSNVDVVVDANIKIKEIGMDGPSILFRRSEQK